MDENKETRKGIPPKGCLLMLACIFLGAACIGLSVWLDSLFLKNVTYMAIGATAGIIADVYFQSKKWVKKIHDMAMDRICHSPTRYGRHIYLD